MCYIPALRAFLGRCGGLPARLPPARRVARLASGLAVHPDDSAGVYILAGDPLFLFVHLANHFNGFDFLFGVQVVNTNFRGFFDDLFFFDDF